MYSEEERDGGEVVAFAAFSNDSTCHHRLASSKRGFETFVIEKGRCIYGKVTEKKPCF